MERIEKQPFIREEMRIPDVTDMDGLVSLMGRSMDNEESFHIDLLLASLSRMHPFVKQEDVERRQRSCPFTLEISLETY